jgi:flagellar biosynthetic protein FliO
MMRGGILSWMLIFGLMSGMAQATDSADVPVLPVVEETSPAPVYLEEEFQSLEMPARDKVRPVNVGALIFRMFGALAIVLGLLYIGAFIVKRWLLPARQGDRRLINVIDSLYLGPKRVIYLVDVAGEALVIGADGNTLTMLTRLDGKNVDDLYRSAGQSERFSGVMGSFMKEFNSSLEGKEKDSHNRDTGSDGALKSSIQDIHSQIQKLKRMKGEL